LCESVLAKKFLVPGEIPLASREAAIAAFAKSWRRDNEKNAPETAPGD